MNLDKFKNRLFGRTLGRSNKKINMEKYFQRIEQNRIDKLDINKNYILDIGTGYGETTFHLANKFKRCTIISCENYINGNLKLLDNIEKYNLKNVKIFPGNVNEILDTNNKDTFFSLVWIFFPDPWPKKRHFKRRLITASFLEKIYFFLKKNAEIHIVTDSSSYIKFILNTIYNSQKYFKWINQDFLFLDFKDYYDFETKFYKKAVISSRNPTIFILKKI